MHLELKGNKIDNWPSLVPYIQPKKKQKMGVGKCRQKRWEDREQMSPSPVRPWLRADIVCHAHFELGPDVYNFFFNFIFFCFLGPHMKVPRWVVESELQLTAYTTATATQDLSHVCNLHHNSRQHWTLNPLSEARDRICILIDTSQICFCCTSTGTPEMYTIVIIAF